MSKKPKKLSLQDQSFYDKHRRYIEVLSDGRTVFRGTQLSVFDIGSLLSFGETKTSILADYEALNPDDLKFAKIFYAIESNKEVEELVPNYNSTTAAIQKLRNIAEESK